MLYMTMGSMLVDIKYVPPYVSNYLRTNIVFSVLLFSTVYFTGMITVSDFILIIRNIIIFVMNHPVAIDQQYGNSGNSLLIH